MSVRKPDWVPATVMAKLVSVAWHEGYQTALANCETAVYQGEDALHALLNDKDKHE
jgi:isopropylmalate/homocitrate/citramalate synthase